MQKRLSVFISYSRHDKKIVEQLAEILERGGQRPWIDRDLMPGQRWKNELMKSIISCDAFLFALSPDALISEWCQWEYEEAVRQNKAIFPVLVREIGELPEKLKQLGEFQFLDVSGGISPDSVAALIGALFMARPVNKIKTEDEPETELDLRRKKTAPLDSEQSSDLEFEIPPVEGTEPLTRLPMPMENPLPAGVMATLSIIKSPTAMPSTVNMIKTIFEIGRSSERDLRIDEKRISKLHVTLYWANGAFFLIDYSMNGTWLNGERMVSNRSYKLAVNFTHLIDMAGNYTVLHFHYSLPKDD